MKKIVIYPVVFATTGLLCLTAWVNDFVTLNGAKTVYTASCEQGAWKDGVCNGVLKAGNRYRFKTLKAHREVIFWTAGAAEQSGKLTQCTIENAKEWSCPPSTDNPRAIIQAMKFGKPVEQPSELTRTYHPVPKWKWLLLNSGFPYFHEANW